MVDRRIGQLFGSHGNDGTGDMAPGEYATVPRTGRERNGNLSLYYKSITCNKFFVQTRNGGQEQNSPRMNANGRK
jgi:hypothetical protein